MASLKDLKNRIGSVKSTKKITKAMQMVAASKLRRAQEAAERSRPYAQAMERVIASLADSVKASPNAPALLREPDDPRTWLIVCATSERGLCGGFNTNIVRLTRERVARVEAEGGEAKILCIGKKGRDQLKRLYGDKIIDTVELIANKIPAFDEAAAIGERVRTLHEEGLFDVCEIVFAEFVNVVTQTPAKRRLIPAEIPEGEDEGAPDLKGAVYDYEPDEETLIAEILPKNVNTQIFKALLENAAGEQGARMSAMDNATRNAGDLIDDLTLQYNRSRQEKITTELTEIVSGAEAL